MQLNETAARIDNQLENVCKKILRVELEICAVRPQANLAGGARTGEAQHHLAYKEHYERTGGK